MNRLTTRLLRWLDPLFALTLAGALMMVAITAWPGSARAADTTTEARSTGDFEAVQTLGPMVRLRQGAATSLGVTADRQLLAQLETVVEDSRMGKTLVVRWKRGTRVHIWNGRDEPVVTVVAPRITGLLVSGSGDIVADGLTPASLSARVEGSGDIRLTGVATDTLALAVAGSRATSALPGGPASWRPAWPAAATSAPMAWPPMRWRSASPAAAT